jgi:nitroreductase
MTGSAAKRKNGLLEMIKDRRSVREYTDKKIDKWILEELVDAAHLAPSGRNAQPWEFVVITDRNVLRKLASVRNMPFIGNAAACIVVCGDSSSKWIMNDCSAAAENIILAAKSFGIGSCWVAGVYSEYCEDAKKLLGIPDSITIVSFLPLGYFDKNPEPHGKRELKSVLHWEKY